MLDSKPRRVNASATGKSTRRRKGARVTVRASRHDQKDHEATTVDFPTLYAPSPTGRCLACDKPREDVVALAGNEDNPATTPVQERMCGGCRARRGLLFIPMSPDDVVTTYQS